MIGELLKINSIRHIISVDDCYLDIDEDEMKATLYGDMAESFDKYEELIKGMGKEQLLIEIKELLELRDEKYTLISSFLESFTKEELKQLYKLSPSVSNSIEEKDKLINFLNALKDNGDINSFELISSAKDALECEYAKQAEEAEETEGILWLIDRNFSRSGESENAGLELAKTIVGRKGGPSNYVYILSAMQDDTGGDYDSIEREFDSYLQANYDLREASFIYYLYKQRIIPEKPDKMAKALAQGFKRKVCYELFDLYISSMQKSIRDSSEKLRAVRQDTLNYLFDEMVKENGESYLEFLGRFVKIFQDDAYQNALADNYEKIAEKMHYYKQISDIVHMQAGDKRKETEKVKEFRNIELYNYHINRQHLEISTGDIFKINDKYYFLASQPCDTCLREDGSRILREANLLLIEDNNSAPIFTHKLSCFEGYKTPVIKLRAQLIFPFEILDLCVLDENGMASVGLAELENIDSIQGNFFTERFRNRLRCIFPQFQQIRKDHKLMNNFFTNDCIVEKEEIKNAYNRCIRVKPELLEYSEDKLRLCYNVQRICRLEELISVDIVNEFGINVSRIGHAFDFTERTQRNA